MGKDKLILSGMQFYGRHGVFPEEKAMGQKFVIDVELSLDLRKAGTSDEISHSPNYADVYATVKNVTTQNSFNLIEALAEAIAQKILAKYRVDQVRVRIQKPHAPISGIFDYMGCEITRGNKE
ncbi:MAG: dihydroneopterin aldolase [Firmicutes bacterium HGW-Firmicutes-14]|jgi:dihydroneopterin aldolase|nr:MAG: dihydroneopterin aldolase [Firmicutes bacterium HGW-Firmicutes-14]